MDDLWRSTRYAVRLLRRTPAFTATSILTLAISIGACTAIFAIVYSVLLAPLPFAEPGRLVHLWQLGAHGGRSQFSDPNYADVRDRARSFEQLAQYSGVRDSVSVGTVPVRARIVVVSREMPRVLRVEPALGRSFSPDEQRVGGPAAAVVSDAFWRQYLQGDRELSRHTITYDGEPYAVVGVLAPGVQFPSFAADLWIARERFAPLPSRTAHNWRVIGRLRDGVVLEQAQAETRAIARSLKQQYGDDTWMVDASVVPLQAEIVAAARLPLLVLLGGAIFLLLVGCANVANLLLTRAVARQREIAVRAAVGAGRGSLLASFVAEAMLLALAGGLLGVALADVGIGAWAGLAPAGLPRMDEVRVSWPVLVFALAAACGSAVSMGLVSGWRVTRVAGVDELREGSRTPGAAVGAARVRTLLVIAQIATSVILLVGAGLLVRTVRHLLDQDPGFRTEHVMAIELSSPRSNDEGAAERLARFHDDLLDRLRALPGVVAAGGINALPLGGGYSNGTFAILSSADERTIADTVARCGRPTPARRRGALDACDRDTLAVLQNLFRDESRTGSAEFRAAGGDYFRAMGIPVIRGRVFDDRDAPTAPHVAVISERLAKMRWPGHDPLGLRIEFGNMDGNLTPLTIVGIVGDVREKGLDAPPQPVLYVNARQRPETTAGFTVVLHATADPAWLMTRSHEIVSRLAPDATLQARTIEQVISSSIADRRLVMLLLVGFAAAAVLLAAIGIYGIVAYGVAQRRPEIGVRLALGAQARDIHRLVLGQGLRLALAGVGAGIVLAAASTRVLSSMLYGVRAGDPMTYAGVALLLGVLVAAAAHIPARRAARVDPAAALRAE